MPNLPDLRRYQSEVLGGLLYSLHEAPGETFTVMFPRQSGKNEVSAALVSVLLLTNAESGGSVIVCAPTLYPQASISLERTAARLRNRWLPWKMSLDGNTIRFGNATATFLSGSPLANVAGHTASLLLIGDEAQDLDEGWFNRQFRPMTASTGACTVLFGTPWGGDSLLETAAEANRKRDSRLRGVRYEDFLPWHHEIKWQQAELHNKPYGHYVRQERERLGARHPIYLSQYELIAGQAEQRLLSSGQLWALEGPFAALDAPTPGERYAGGLDFGGEKAGGDSTVLTIARIAGAAAEVVAAFSWQGEPYHHVTSLVVELARRWNLERLVCDATGMGSPLTAQLKRELGRVAEPLVFTRREKSALGFELLAGAETGGLRIAPPSTPGLRLLWDELRACRAEPRSGGHLSWSAPSGIHDDAVASLALCLRAASGAGPARLATGRRRPA